MKAKSKTWFITGTSRGFGRIWAEAALSRGDRVVATARDTKALSELVEKFGAQVLPLQLDVCDRKSVFQAVAAAHENFGQLDVVVNNAGYGLLGMVEEVSEQQARDQFETNFFGALWVTQAVLPILRRQRSGHILQISTIGGVTAFPYFGLYNASKWALEGMTQALAAEVSDFGVKVTLIEPTAFATQWAGSSAVHASPSNAYDVIREQILSMWSNQLPGNPHASADALLELVDSEHPPLRVFFGDMLSMVRAEYAQRLDEWEQWQRLAQEAVG